MAWSGNSQGYINTVVNLGPNVAGQNIILRFRFGSDEATNGAGWWIDTLTVGGGSATPTLGVSPTPPRTPTPTPAVTPTVNPSPSPGTITMQFSSPTYMDDESQTATISVTRVVTDGPGVTSTVHTRHLTARQLGERHVRRAWITFRHRER